MRKTLIATWCSILISCTTTYGAPNQDAKLSLHDKSAIIQLAFEIKLKHEGPLKFSELIIAEDNMSKKLIPQIPGF